MQLDGTPLSWSTPELGQREATVKTMKTINVKRPASEGKSGNMIQTRSENYIKNKSSIEFQPPDDGLQPTSDGLPTASDGLQPTSDGPTYD